MREFRLRRHTSPIGSYSFAWFSRVGRTNGWAKVTCAQREPLAIAGYALDGTKWDGMYIGRRKGNDFLYAGKVDHGFSPVPRTGQWFTIEIKTPESSVGPRSLVSKFYLAGTNICFRLGD